MRGPSSAGIAVPGQAIVRERLVAAIPMLAVAYGILAVANFGLNVVVGKSLGAAALGTFALAVAAARIMYAVADLGLAAHLTRLVSRDARVAADKFPKFVAFRIVTIPVIVSGAIVAARVYASDETAVFCVVAIAIGCLQIQVLYETLMLALERRSAAALLSLFTSGSVIAGCTLWFVARGSLFEYAVMYAATTVIGLTAAIIWSGSRLGLWPGIRVYRSELRADLARSWPLGASVLLGLLSLRCPQLILGAFATPADVGPLAAADMFVTAAAVLQTVVSNATFARFAAFYGRGPSEFRTIYWASNAVLLFIGLLAAAGFTLFGGPLLAWIFPSKDFRVAATLIPIVAWSTPALLVVQHHLMIFAASDRERSSLAFMIGWSVLTIALQLVLVPAFGVQGAAWGILLGRTLGLGALVAVVARTRLYRGSLACALG